MSKIYCVVCGQSKISISEMDRLIDANVRLWRENEALKAQLAKADRWQGTEFPVRFTLRDLVITIDREK